MTRSISLVSALAAPVFSLACSCFGPLTFCGTLYPTGPNPEWWTPDAVVLGVKVGDFQHGMDVKVLESLSGSLAVDDTVRVWGDCGLLCRHYPTTWAVGDTVIWAFRFTDLVGNQLCGTNFEVADDYMISICGIYWLEYDQGIVTGPITTETVQTLTYAQFLQTIEGCMPMSVAPVPEEPEITIAYANVTPIVGMTGVANGATLRVIDAMGREVTAMPWDGSPTPLSAPSAGAYTVQVVAGGRRWVSNVLVAGEGR